MKRRTTLHCALGACLAGLSLFGVFHFVRVLQDRNENRIRFNDSTAYCYGLYASVTECRKENNCLILVYVLQNPDQKIVFLDSHHLNVHLFDEFGAPTRQVLVKTVTDEEFILRQKKTLELRIVVELEALDRCVAVQLQERPALVTHLVSIK